MSGKRARAVLVLVGAATLGAGPTLGMASRTAPAAAAPPAAAPVPKLPAIPQPSGVSFLAAVAPGLPPHLIGVSGFGWLVNGNTTSGVSLEQLPHQVQLAYDAGIRITRFDLSWNVTEPQPGIYDWSSYDAWLPVLWAGGMRVLLILDYANYYYNGFGSPSTPDGIAAFARWAGAAAEHYKGKQIVWEVYNEPLNFWRAPTNTTPEPVPGNTPPRPGSGACLMCAHNGSTVLRACYNHR